MGNRVGGRVGRVMGNAKDNLAKRIACSFWKSIEDLEKMSKDCHR